VFREARTSAFERGAIFKNIVSSDGLMMICLSVSPPYDRKLPLGWSLLGRSKWLAEMHWWLKLARLMADCYRLMGS